MREEYRTSYQERTAQSRRHGHRLWSVLIAVVGLAPLLLAACATNTAQTGGLAKAQVFTWPYFDGNATNPSAPNIFHDEILDPAASGWLQDSATISMLYTNLLTFDSALNLVPDAATSMPTVDPTGTIYTFHLRPNMRFSDGTSLTAQDFAYGINRALDPNLCTKLDVKSYPGAAQNNSICTNMAHQPGTAEATGYLGHILGAVARSNGTSPTVIGTGVIVIDPLTLEIKLDSPVRFFLDALTYSTSAPMEKSLVENPKYAGGLWVEHLNQGGCSGPFMVQSYGVDAQGDATQLTMVPNPYWESAWGKHITLNQVVRPAVSTYEAEYANYRAGQYDFTDVPLEDYNFAQAQSDFNEVASLETDYFGLNFHVAPFDNTAIRQAFDLALNKQFLVDSVEAGGAIPTNHIIPEGMPGFDPNLLTPPPDRTESITGNQAAARQLLTQQQQKCGGAAGTANPPYDWCAYITGSSPLPIKVYANSGNQTRVRLITQAAQAWSSALSYTLNGASVPLNVQAEPVDGSALADTVYGGSNTYQMWLIGWVADYPDPQDFTTLQFTANAPDNAGYWSVPGLDSLLKQADVEPDAGKRMQDYNTAEQMIVDASPWIPIQQAKLPWRLRPWVRGFTLSPLEVMPDLNWPNVAILNLQS